jgi:iron complex outermembrane receptor protein
MRKSRRNETYHRPAAALRAAARLAAALLAGALTPAAYSANTVESLKQLSIESLMNVEVYSASRRLETTQSTASASYVLTSEDLARAAITSVPDALRLVPGVQVGRVDANKWAVGMRGFNSRESNKLLVLVDGRTVYDALFSGTLWEAQDFMIEDLDRIEVIRGPGGTLWGANAFNGVINIVSRRAGYAGSAGLRRDRHGGSVHRRRALRLAHRRGPARARVREGLFARRGPRLPGPGP